MEHHHQEVKAMLRNLMWQRPSNQDVGGHGDPASNAGEPGEREKGSECTQGGFGRRATPDRGSHFALSERLAGFVGCRFEPEPSGK